MASTVPSPSCRVTGFRHPMGIGRVNAEIPVGGTLEDVLLAAGFEPRPRFRVAVTTSRRWTASPSRPSSSPWWPRTRASS